MLDFINKLRNGNKIVLVLLLCIILVAGFLLYKNYPRAISISNSKKEEAKEIKIDNSAKFSFSPQTISIAVGKEFAVDVLIDPAQHKVSNADLIFSYDKTKLKLNSISQSEKFSQVLGTDVSRGGMALYSAATGFENNVSDKAVYATLHFVSLEKTNSTIIEVDKEKSGIYADDQPGINNLGSSGEALATINE